MCMNEYETAVGFRAPDPEEIAPLFPQYEILGLVATGGMGAVYKAIQISLDRVVAIKVLPSEFSQDAQFCSGFEAEAKAMAKLNHPNLIGVYDFGEAGGMLFIVMEFVEGQSLHDLCQGHALEPAEAMRIMEGVCHGLAHAHEHGILHRDIKPANILMDERNEPKVGDFGLARPLDTGVAEGEAIFGTPGYTAPEVLTPPHQFDHRADLFSLGVMLHELLTAQLPDAARVSASAIAHCDRRLDDVIRKAIHPDPMGRHHSASDMAAEIHRVAHSVSTRIIVNAPNSGVQRHSALAVPGRQAAAGYSAPAHGHAALGRPGGATLQQSQGSGSGMGVWLLIIGIIVLFVIVFRGSLVAAFNDKEPEGPSSEDKLEEFIGAPIGEE